ncbi:MAG: GIY-YIG nuclease family protein [bacterium]|nr:GIY-YIG nuclease family protein [bacterium]
MFATYILKSKTTNRYYIGYTSNVGKRIIYHNTGRNISTRSGIPWSLVYSESFETRAEAWKREHQIKSYKSGEAFKKLIQ